MNLGIGWDWIFTMWPAVNRFVAGGNPYAPPAMKGFAFVYPPWLLPLLVPSALLGYYGGFVMAFITLTGLMALCARLKKPRLVFLLILSYPFLALMVNWNVDGFVLWGLAIGGPLGFFFLSVKPQVASLVGLVWIYQTYKQDGWMGVFRLVSPTILVAILFTIRYPQWIAALFAAPSLGPVLPRLNLWPWLILPGLILAIYAVRKNRESFASVGTWMVAPYAQFHSAIAAFTYVASENVYAGIVLVVLSWVYGYLFATGKI
jgi:hypothetical protein